MKYYLAIDLGATSGRHIIAHKENGEIVLNEIHRFKTCMDDSSFGLVSANLFMNLKFFSLNFSIRYLQHSRCFSFFTHSQILRFVEKIIDKLYE